MLPALDYVEGGGDKKKISSKPSQVHQGPYNMSFIKQVCSVKTTEY